MFGRRSAHFLPHNFYYEIKLGTFSPSLHQLFALSKISDYKLTDWLHVFGFNVEEIPRLQVLLPTKRTILLDSSVTDPNAWVARLRNKPGIRVIPPMAPLSQLLEVGSPIRQSSLLEMNTEHFLYAKIGREDALAFPDLLSGSIARINPRLAHDLPANRESSDRLFLVEHAKGICCCRILCRGKNRISLVSAHLPYAQIELQLHREARILGAVDLEIRQVSRAARPQVPAELAKRWNPQPITQEPSTLGNILRHARRRVALSLREASDLSGRIAMLLGNERYSISAGSLLDSETRDRAPRHFEKAISLCLVYGISFQRFLEIVGLRSDLAGRDPIPDRLFSRTPPERMQVVESPKADDYERSGVLGELLNRVEDIPLFLKGAIEELSGIDATSLRSFFWHGDAVKPLHRYLENAIIVSVDRHRKRPVDSRSLPAWDQSLYVVLKRDGSYLCGPTFVEDGNLVVHTDSERLTRRHEFRTHRDAEVIGQVSAIMRKL